MAVQLTKIYNVPLNWLEPESLTGSSPISIVEQKVIFLLVTRFSGRVLLIDVTLMHCST